MSPTLQIEQPVASTGMGQQPRRLRVCHVSLGLTTGGLERLLVEIARFHQRDLFELTFVALYDGGVPAEEIRQTGCDVQILKTQSQGRLRRALNLAKLFRERKVDVVHTHNTFPHIYGTAAARIAGVPVVVHTRHGQTIGHGRFHQLQFRLASRFCDRIVAVSQDAARMCESVDHLPHNKISCILNGIDLHRFAYHGPAKHPTAIAVARLSPEKDFPNLLRAVSLVVPQIPDFRLKIVGGGAELPKLQALVQKLRLGPYVDLLGERKDIPQLLSQAAFFISSSLTEGVSLTLLEAMAVGLPIVATAVGGTPEVVDPGVTGLLCPSANSAALASALVEMCRQPDRWPEFGQAARARVEARFDIHQMCRNYEDLYCQLLKQKQIPLPV